jgi:hypothetical protein
MGIEKVSIFVITTDAMQNAFESCKFHLICRMHWGFNLVLRHKNLSARLEGFLMPEKTAISGARYK